MKLIIAGSRSITDYAAVREAVIRSGLWVLHKHELEIVSGMAGGVDTLGEEFARKNGLVLHRRPAKWGDIDVTGAVVRKRYDGKLYNAVAGHWRNEEMAQESKALVAVWDGVSTGTQDMIKRAYKHKLFVYVYNLKEQR